MTTPFSPIRDAVFKMTKTDTAAQTFTIASASPGAAYGNVYMSVPQGTNTVQATWDGACAVEVYYGPSPDWASRRKVGEIPSGTRNITRRLTFPIAADTTTYVIFLRAAMTDAADLPYCAGVTITNMRIPEIKI